MTTADPTSPPTGSPPGGSCMPCDPEVQRMIGKAPRIALWMALGGAMAEYIFYVTGSFTAAGTPGPVLNQPPLGSNNNNIQRDLLIHDIDVDIQTKDAFTGNILKPEGDLAYDYTSGIQCRVQIDGYNKRTTPVFPLKALPKLVSPQAPLLFLEENDIYMDFSVTTPLPSDSTIITCTFVCWTPAGDGVFRMKAKECFDELDDLGYCTSFGRRVFGCQ